MLYTYKELLEIEKSRYNIEKKLKKKELFKVGDGIYSSKEIVNPTLIYAKKYPNAIVTLDNAFYFYGLTDVIPDKCYLATKQKASVIKNKDIVQIFTTDELFEIGKAQVEIDGMLVNMYDRERLLIELIRRKKQISLDYYKEIINNYRDSIYKISMKRVEKYASEFNIEDHILDTIQLEVL